MRPRTHERTESTMNRVVAIAVCGLALSACSGMPSWMSFELPKATPAATTIQFESVPAGAEAKVSVGGQACRTPCALPIAAEEFTVSFTLAGYQPQNVPVRITPPTEPIDPNTGQAPPPRMVPNPVYVELQPTPPPPPARKRRPPAPRPAKPAPAASSPPPAAMAPAPAPAAAWPPPPPPQR
jgi:hypothetical protein